ncbi:MAG: nitrilase-related carbon-nitrogen hydrolase [Trueperaceae bacterium]
MMRLLAAATLTAALGGMTFRLDGGAYLAWIALVPYLAMVVRERRLWRGALAGAIASLGFGLAAFEGVAAVEPWAYLVLVTLASLPWALVGVGIVGTVRRWGPAAGLAFAPVAIAAAEFVVAQRAWLGDFANGLMQWGYSQDGTLWMQAAGWSGVTGLTLVIVAANAAWVALASLRHASGGTRSAHAAIVVVVGGLVVATASTPVPGAAVPDATREPLRVALVQGAVSSTDSLLARFDREAARVMVTPYAELTRTAAERDADLVVWGETAVPMPVRPGHVPDYLAEALAPAPIALVGGVAYAGGRSFNTVFHVEDGVVREVYRKRALVPLVERAYERGVRVPPLDVNGVPIGLGVCLDAVFGSLAREAVIDGAGVLVYLTEDAFASRTITPRQHLRVAAFRAVETGRPVAFVNQSGPSAAFGPDGRALEAIPFGRTAGAVVELRAHRGVTPYVRFGDVVGPFAVAVVLVLTVGGIASARRR